MDNNFKIFKPDDLNGLATGTPDLQRKAAVIKQRFDFRRSVYHTQRNNITDFDRWRDLNDLLNQFEQTQFNVWNQKWANINRANDINQIRNYFEEGNLRWSGKSGHKLKLNLCFYGSQKSTKKSSQVRFII